MNEKQKLEAVQNVMILVLGRVEMTFEEFRKKCADEFQARWGGQESEITVRFAETNFGFLRNEPPFIRDLDHGVIRIEDVARIILAEKAEVGRSATTEDIVDTLVHELKKKGRDLSKADVKAVLAELKTMIANHLGKDGPGKFTIPGLCSITVVDRTGPDPVKVNPLSALKEMAKG